MPETPNASPGRVLLSVRQFAARHPAFTQPGIRHLIHCSEERHASKGKLPGNGLKETGAILRCGRKVLIDEQAFFAWLHARNSIPPTAPESPAKRVAA